LAQFERGRMDEMGSPSPRPPSKKKNPNWQKREAKRRRARIRNRQAREDDNVVQFRKGNQALTSGVSSSLSTTAREQSNRQRNESWGPRELDAATSPKDPPKGRRQAKPQKGTTNISSTFVEATQDARTPRLPPSSKHLPPQDIRRDVTSSPPTGPRSQQSNESSPASLFRGSQQAQSSAAPGGSRPSLSGLTRGFSGQPQRPRSRGRSNIRGRGAKRMPRGQRGR
jgi:hypothetical protein